MAKSVSYALSSRGMILIEGDTAYDMDFAMFYTLYHVFKQESIQGIHYIIYFNHAFDNIFATITDIIIYHIFSGKYSSFGYLIKCHMPTLYHTPTLYTLLFNYMIECIKHGTKFIWRSIKVWIKWTVLKLLQKFEFLLSKNLCTLIIM
jgi:hypothetical protein